MGEGGGGGGGRAGADGGGGDDDDIENGERSFEASGPAVRVVQGAGDAAIII